MDMDVVCENGHRNVVTRGVPAEGVQTITLDEDALGYATVSAPGTYAYEMGGCCWQAACDAVLSEER